MNLIAKLQMIAAAALSGFVCLSLGYFIGHWAGDSDGYDRAMQKMAQAGVQAATTAGQDRERTEHVEKNMDDAAIDSGLRELGIMRRNDDR